MKKNLKRNSKVALQNRPPLLLDEQMLLYKIKERTSKLNQNNVTRTQAYLNFYCRFPEIHWAFLGHMVSRNGGWNMTDLKGGQLSRLLAKKEAEAYFTFLERGNWLIFQDAFPQFLVYEEGHKRNQNLSYLLPHLNVSTFMETIWNHFWKDHDSYILAISLIINEQNYLENRVINNPIFQKSVFDTIEFKLQDFLSMNHILFPYKENGKVRLTGQTLHHFESLHERILLGKRLYELLFTDSKRLDLIEQWAKANPHSGSRKDYWPHIFNDVDEGVPSMILKPRLKECQIIRDSPKIYSPKLENAWKNRIQPSAEVMEWYKDWRIIRYLLHSGENVDGEVEDEYCKTLEQLELAAITKKAISLFD
nr:DUF2515 family protein [Calidifontibacillus oryziterrae]